jgi:hypothetical protein
MYDGKSKYVVYRYNGHPSSDEIELDAQGDLSFIKGDIVERPGRNWRVTSAHFEERRDDLRAIPSLLVCLVDHF